MEPRLFINYNQDCKECGYQIQLNLSNLRPEKLMYSIYDYQGQMVKHVVPCKIISSNGHSYSSSVEIADVFCENCIETVLNREFHTLFHPESMLGRKARKKNIKAVLENRPK